MKNLVRKKSFQSFLYTALIVTVVALSGDTGSIIPY